MTELTQELVRSLFDYKDGFLYWKISNNRKIHIGDKAGSFNGRYYQIGINDKKYLNHRLIFLYHYGYLPEFVDHIDNNPSNNKIGNLRKLTNSQNCMNSKSRKGSSKYKGVSWDKSINKWRSQIQINGKKKHLGYFINEMEAVIVYNNAIIKYFKEFVWLNDLG